MRSLSAILAFAPTQLAEARDRVIRTHPDPRSSVGRPDPVGFDALRRRMEEAAAAPDPGRALQRLARELHRRECIAVVRAIGNWIELRDAISTFARARPIIPHVNILWQTWQFFPQIDSIRDLLAYMTNRFGTSHAVGSQYARDAEGWMSAQRPVDALVNWCDRKNVPWNRLAQIPDSPFQPNTPLIRQIFHRTLQIGSSAQLIAIPEKTILDGWEQMAGIPRMEACANLLRRIEPNRWRECDILLETIRNSYGIPARSGVKLRRAADPRRALMAFWERVPEEYQEAFRQYFIKRDLVLAFRGDATPDRMNFWISRSQEITSVMHGTVGGTYSEINWSLIDFPGFSVVEFFAVGNAAYLYPDTHPIILRIESGEQTYSVESLKHRSFEFLPGGDNRIIHQSGWEHGAHQKLEEWKRHYS